VTLCWFAWLGSDEKAVGAIAQAAAVDLDGAPAGRLAAWGGGRKPVRAAVRMAARVVDPEGAGASISLVLLDRDRSPLFDDPTVSGALRRVLAEPAPDAVSTFVRDASHFAGAVTVRRLRPERLRDDPFARLGHAVLLRVGPGLFGSPPPVPGPGTQRYSGLPWPAAGF